MFVGSPFLQRRADIWVPEAPHSVRPDVYQRLLEGTYDKPFLVEIEQERLLCFALDGSVQTTMDLRDPYALVSGYTRKMMGFLLLQPHPRDILVLGLGGGALPKYCHRYLPDTRLTVVEVDPEVIALLKKADVLLNLEKALKKTIKADTQALHMKTKATIESLTPEQVQMLLEAKWIQPLVENLHTLPTRILAELNQKLKALSQKYTETLPEMERQIDDTETELAAMLDQLTGSEDDLSGLAELKKLLGGN